MQATGITNSWESLRDLVGPPGTIASLLKGRGDGGPTWWLPSLTYLAYQTAEQSETRAVLDEFASRRDELGYAVVEEQTDAVIGLSIQPWPLVDDQGRLRFPIAADPVQLDVAESDLARLLSGHRQRWHELGLLPEGLLERRVQLGDALALRVADEPDPSGIRALKHPDDTHQRSIGGLLARDATGSVSVPIVDVTWDAREAGKLAHYAAAAGVAVPDAQDPAMAPVTQETEARYMVGFRDGIDPRDVHLDTASSDALEEGL